jgi:hypothetical protein
VNGKQMAAALGISPAMVSRLRKRGMPMDTAERAERWRRRNLDEARMKGMRIDTPGELPAPAARPLARPPRALDAVDELRQLMSPYSPIDGPLPEPVADQVRAALRRLPVEQFLQLYEEEWYFFHAVWAVLPPAVGEWDSWEPEGCNDDWFEPIPDIDLPLLHLVVAGVAGFEFDPAPGPVRGAFRDCVRLPAVARIRGTGV